MNIGVLAIQGDYEAHKARLEQLGAAVTLVRKPEQLDAIDAIIIPGGESTTFLNFLEELARTPKCASSSEVGVQRTSH